MGARTFITSPDPRFPAGTNVSVYLRSSQPAVPPIPSGAPAAGSVAVFGPVAVGADGRATFTGLDDLTEYLIYAAAPDRWARFRTGLTRSDQAAAAANAISGVISPADRSLLAWTIDPGSARDSNSPTNGLIRGSRIKHPGGLITGLAYVSLSPQVGGVAGQNFLGIYDTAGNRLAQTADLTAAWAAANVVEVTSPLTAPINLPAGFYDIVVLANMNAGLNLGLVCWSGAAFVPSFGAAASGLPFRGFTADAGAVALPAVLAAKTRRDGIDLFGLY